MDKLITFAVPCYNSAAYMEHCVDTLLQGGSDIEIILVDDGSTKDDTPAICDRYQEQYPDIVRAIHQPNGGHMLVCNYVYEHVEDNTQRVMHYRNVFPRNRVFGWEQIGRFRPSQYLLMHSVIYRTQLLRDCGLELPKHTFYVDNIFVYQPLPSVKNIYYLDVDLYRYFIGRSDQSVNEKVMVTRVDQQLRVTYQMIDSHDLRTVGADHKKLARYMFNYLAMMMAISSIFLVIDGRPEALGKKTQLWEYLRTVDSGLYHKMKYRAVSAFTNFPGYQGRKLSVQLYRLARKIYKFN